METLAQVLSYEFCYMYNNTFFTKKLRITASKIRLSLSVNPTKWSNTLKQFVGKLPTSCGVDDSALQYSPTILTEYGK